MTDRSFLMKILHRFFGSMKTTQLKTDQQAAMESFEMACGLHRALSEVKSLDLREVFVAMCFAGLCCRSVFIYFSDEPPDWKKDGKARDLAMFDLKPLKALIEINRKSIQRAESVSALVRLGIESLISAASEFTSGCSNRKYGSQVGIADFKADADRILATTYSILEELGCNLPKQ